MRYIRFFGGNGYCSCDWEEVAVVDDDTTDRDLDQQAYNLAMDYAEGYDYVAEGYDIDTGWESEEAENEYYEGVTSNWQEITEDEYNEALAD